MPFKLNFIETKAENEESLARLFFSFAKFYFRC